MKTLWDKFGPADLLAVILVIGVFLLDGDGVKAGLPTALAVIIGFYFRHVSGTRQKVDIQSEIKPGAMK